MNDCDCQSVIVNQWMIDSICMYRDRPWMLSKVCTRLYLQRKYGKWRCTLRSLGCMTRPLRPEASQATSDFSQSVYRDELKGGLVLQSSSQTGPGRNFLQPRAHLFTRLGTASSKFAAALGIICFLTNQGTAKYTLNIGIFNSYRTNPSRCTYKYGRNPASFHSRSEWK